MKVRVVGAFAALGMLLTSYSVWSLTSDRVTAATGRPGGEWREPSRRTDPDEPRGAPFGQSGTLRVDARLGHARLPSAASSETFVLVRVRADDRATGLPTKRHLAIAIDRSGSMAGKRLKNALAAAQGAVRRLSDGDFVSVVEYSSSSNVLVPPTELDGASRERVVARIGSLTAGGETCISCALETTTSVLRQQSQGVSRVLLLSDGEATTGVRDVAGMGRVADSVRALGATVTTVGVDVDYNERMMTTIAQATNGRHYFVASPEGLPQIFDQELSGLERSVAREAELTLDLAPGVELLDVPDRTFRREGSEIRVSLGSFAAGEERSVLARVRVQADAGREQAIARSRLAYDDLSRGGRGEERGELFAVLTTDGSRSPIDPEVEERVQRSGAVTALNEANGLFAAGDAVAARRRVEAKLDEVREGRRVAVAAAPEPRKAALAQEFDKAEAALGSAASAFAEPPSPTSSPADEERRSNVIRKQNAAGAAELAF
jgi:Ca-activated chloride channel family protein